MILSSEFRTTRANQPTVNVKEMDDAYMIEVAAPGLDRKDFHHLRRRDVG